MNVAARISLARVRETEKWSRRSLEQIGEGDWTPRDSNLADLLAVLPALVEAVEAAANRVHWLESADINAEMRGASSLSEALAIFDFTESCEGEPQARGASTPATVSTPAPGRVEDHSASPASEASSPSDFTAQA